MSTPAPSPLQPGWTPQQFHRDRIAEQLEADRQAREAAVPPAAPKRTRTRKTSTRKAAE